jgi:hypothetical protein
MFAKKVNWMLILDSCKKPLGDALVSKIVYKGSQV